ncbi:GPW/gp25 family protein [Aquabacterium sp. OR-4]|uniref:GPW/gp25 family protein n=1 Tax=Aquabacterium sp. OR-4 TaxID=2978127 RepID=UPI0021B3144C|nr:GPW/gp25 family protein [Aquabacterium sp. OR-4]MDT7836288.1 GPW/gp25 family protein [Aquabacterium sp. OR-4]
MAGADAFLGRGWAFPPRFAAAGEGVAMASGTDDVAESLAILLATRRGERVLLERYGCDLAEFLFAEITPSLVGQVRDLVSDAILEYEPRVQLNSVEVGTERADEGVLVVAVDYTVRATNSRFNMVWPFHVDEAVRPLDGG